MQIPRVQFCCFCIDVRTGALILGWLGAISYPLGFITKMMQTGEEHNDNAQSGMNISWFIFYGVQTIVSIFLLLGVFRKKPEYCVPWLIASICAIVYTLVILVLAFIFFGSGGIGAIFVLGPYAGKLEFLSLKTVRVTSKVLEQLF